MARPVRTAVAPNPLRPVKSHLIEEYNARTNIVRCDCGWTGNADDFAVHRRAVGTARRDCRACRNAGPARGPKPAGRGIRPLVW